MTNIAVLCRHSELPLCELFTDVLMVHDIDDKHYIDRSFYQHGPIFINKSCFSANVPQKSSRMVVMSSVISLVIIPHDRKQMSFIFINTNPFLSTIFVFLSTLCDFYQQSLCFISMSYIEQTVWVCIPVPVSNYNLVLHRNFQS